MKSNSIVHPFHPVLFLFLEALCLVVAVQYCIEGHPIEINIGENMSTLVLSPL